MKLLKKSFTIFLLLAACCASFTRAQPSDSFSSFISPGCAGEENRDNEICLGRPEGNFYCNPLMLDGVAFHDNVLTLKTTGELKLIKGDPKSGKTVEIPFCLQLQREGMLVTYMCGKGVAFSRFEVSAILKAAQDGDELVVEPANKGDWPARRIVKIVLGC